MPDEMRHDPCLQRLDGDRLTDIVRGRVSRSVWSAREPAGRRVSAEGAVDRQDEWTEKLIGLMLSC